MKVKCVECGRIVKGYVPKGGDGTGYKPYKHNNSDGKDCEGRHLCGDTVKDDTERIIRTAVPGITTKEVKKVVRNKAIKEKVKQITKPKEEKRIRVDKDTKHQKKDGDVICSKCGEPFDPYKKIEYRKNGGKALSTCTHCGFVMKVTKIIPSEEYITGHDGWRRKDSKKKMRKKDRRRAKKLAAEVKLNEARKDTLAFKMED